MKLIWFFTWNMWEFGFGFGFSSNDCEVYLLLGPFTLGVQWFKKELRWPSERT